MQQQLPHISTSLNASLCSVPHTLNYVENELSVCAEELKFINYSMTEVKDIYQEIAGEVFL